MRLFELDQDAGAETLRIQGAFHPETADQAPEGTGTLLMLGPDEPRFWGIFTASPEYSDGAPHPLDRWSKRVITPLAARWGGTAIFPYDGPPYAPFIRWAEATGRIFPAPVGLLVHDEAGLFISFRGAVALPHKLDLPVGTAQNPCLTCATAPCETACPVNAMVPDKPYDVPACQAHVRSPEGRACREQGCLVRRACPVSQRFGRLPAQSAFHMAAFVKE